MITDSPEPPGLPPEATLHMQREYWCFISYRHTDNREPGRQWATWLHQALETYEVPADLVGKNNERGDLIPDRIFPVFRDEVELPADAKLSKPIEAALQRSRFLVVLCSPQAVKSPYVSAEILRFKQLGKNDRILAAIIEGSPNASDDTAQDVSAKECFPHPLRYTVDAQGQLTSERTEPIAPDFRLSDGTQGWTSPAAYRQSLESEELPARQVKERVDAYAEKTHLMLLKIIAGVLGVPLGVLTQRDKAYQLAKAQKRARILYSVASAFAVLTALVIFGGVVAWQQKQKADINATLAQENEKEANLRLAAVHWQNAKLSGGIEFDPNDASPDSGARIQTAHHLFRAALASKAAKDPEGQRQALLAGRWTVRGLSRVSWNNTTMVRVWDDSVGAKRGPLGLKGPLAGAKISADGTFLLAWNEAGALGMWQLGVSSPSESFRIAVPGEAVAGAAPGPDGLALLWLKSGAMQLWDVVMNQPFAKPMMAEGDPVQGAVFSQDGTRILSWGRFGMQSWNASTGEPAKVALPPGATVRFAAISPDSQRFVSGDDGGAVRLWDVANSRPIATLVQYEVPKDIPVGSGEHTFQKQLALQFLGAVFDPTGSVVLTRGANGRMRLFRSSDGSALGEEMEHGELIQGAEFSADGRRIASWGSSMVRIWDVANPQSAGSPMRHPREVRSAAFIDGGRGILTWSDDRVLRWWGLPERHLIAIFPHEQPPSQTSHRGRSLLGAQMDPNGRWLFAVSEDSQFSRWDLALTNGVPDESELTRFEIRSASILSPDGEVQDLSYEEWDRLNARED